MHKPSLLISFSGSETSAYMTHLLMTSNEVRANYSDVVVMFANTGQEREETLEFVRDCERHFGWPVRWIEAVFSPVVGHGVRARETCYEIACREGEPFEDLIAKHGIPNTKRPFCSKELKQRPIVAFMRSLGYPPGTYDTAIGIRADEFDRVAPDAKRRRIVYPLLTRWPTTKPQINQWWAAQPFRLRLKSYQGNCRVCFKKSERRLLTIMNETPGAFAWADRIERTYGLVGAEFLKEERPGYRRVFFRENRDVPALRALLAKRKADGSFSPATDDALWVDTEVDGSGGGESCDAFGQDEGEDPLL